MTKFETKAFECEILGELYNSLDGKCHWYMKYNNDTDKYEEPTEAYDKERLAIIHAIMAKIEKMI